LVGLGLLALGILGALAPGAAVAAAIAALIIGLYVLYPIASLIPLFLWLLVQNSVVAILEARGLAEAGVWLRRSDEAIMLGLFSIAIITDVFGRGKAPLAGLAASICAVSVVAIASAILVGHAPPFVAALDLVLLLKGAVAFVAVKRAAATATPQQRTRALSWVKGAGFAAAGVACIEVVDPDGFRSLVGLPTGTYIRGGWNSLQGPFVHPGVFGWLMGVCALVAVVEALEGKRGAWWSILVFVLGIIASGRRKPLVGVLFASLVIVWLSSAGRVRWKRLGIAVGVTVVVVALFWPLMTELVTSTVQNYVTLRDPLEQARDVMYIASAGLALAHFPLGVGPGLFGGYAARLYYSPLYDQLGLSHVWGLSHDNPTFLTDAFWPHVLGEFGVLGVVAYLWFLGSTLRPAVPFTRGSPSSQRVLARAAVAVMAETVVESIASASFELSLQSFVGFGLLAIASVAVKGEGGAGLRGQLPTAEALPEVLKGDT